MKSAPIILAAISAACGSGAFAKPPLQLVGNAINVQPLRMMAVELRNGTLTSTGDWIPVVGDSHRAAGRASKDFDAFSSDDSGFPIDARLGCASGSLRWFFGTPYSNPNTVEDVDYSVCARSDGAFMNQLDVAWYLTEGDGNHDGSSHCYLAAFLGDDDMDTTCRVSPDALSEIGVILDFGVLAENTGTGNLYYYYSNIGGVSTGGGLCNVHGLCVPMPDDQKGHYRLWIGTDFDGVTFTFAATAQPMLWGTYPHTAIASRYGSQSSSFAWDDDSPTDGKLTAPHECYPYDYGVCPSPLDKTLCWSVLDNQDGCSADLNHDGFVTGEDYDQFVAWFELGDQCADFNNEHDWPYGYVSGEDFDLFIEDFEAGC